MGKGGDKVDAKVDLSLMSLSQRDLIFFLLTSSVTSSCVSTPLSVAAAAEQRLCGCTAWEELEIAVVSWLRLNVGTAREVLGCGACSVSRFQIPIRSENVSCSCWACSPAILLCSEVTNLTERSPSTPWNFSQKSTIAAPVHALQNHGLKEHIRQWIIWGLGT